MKKELALAPLKRIIKKSQDNHYRGVNIGQEALEMYRDLVETLAQELAQELIHAARTTGRMTIKPTDIRYVEALKTERSDRTCPVCKGPTTLLGEVQSNPVWKNYKCQSCGQPFRADSYRTILMKE